MGSDTSKGRTLEPNHNHKKNKNQKARPGYWANVRRDQGPGSNHDSNQKQNMGFRLRSQDKNTHRYRDVEYCKHYA